MKLDQPLCKQFLSQYPVDAARILEQISVQHVAALFEAMPEHSHAAVVAMLPARMAACIEAMTESSAAKILSTISAASAARIYRCLPLTRQQLISSKLSPKAARKIHRFIEFSSVSAGAILNSDVTMLPQDLTVAEAIRHLEHPRHVIHGDIYVVDDSHKLLGLISPGSLLVSSHHARLNDIMSRKTQSVSVHAMNEILLDHPGWDSHLSLPVVDRDNTLLGVIDFITLKSSLGEQKTYSVYDPLQSLLSMLSLYLLSAGQLLDSLFDIMNQQKGNKK